MNNTVLVAILSSIDSIICPVQMNIWLSVFQGYSSFAAVIVAIVIFSMQGMKRSENDYTRAGYVLNYKNFTFYLSLSTVCAFIIGLVLLTIYSCTNLRMWALLLSISFMIPSLVLLIVSIFRIFPVCRNKPFFRKLALKRLKGLLNADLKKAKTVSSHLATYEYCEEIEFIYGIIEANIMQHKFSYAKKALDWFQNTVIGVIPDYLTAQEISKIGIITNTARDSLARVIIDASIKTSTSKKRDLLDDVLIQTELSSQHFIKAGLSICFHSILDAYQLAFEKQHDKVIIKQYASCFAKIGNLIAAISKLDDVSEKLKFKHAVLNTTLVLICHSIHRPESVDSIIKLFVVFLSLDEGLTCSDSDDHKDHTGLGCWIFVNAMLLQISQYVSNLEVQKLTVILYRIMIRRFIDNGFAVRDIPEAVKGFETHWGKIKNSSTGSSLHFCIRKCYTGFDEVRLHLYLLKAVFLIALKSSLGSEGERYLVMKRILDMDGTPLYSKDDFRKIVDSALDAGLMNDPDQEVLNMVEEYISKAKQE